MRPNLAYEERLLSHLAKKYKTETIVIRDVLLIGGSTGEFEKDEVIQSHRSDAARLFRHIRRLVGILNKDHLKKYADERGDIKPEYQCTVTRLCTSEFSFYTRKPLSMIEFQNLLTKIEKMAKNCSENLHLLLSSFAVANGDKILNIVLYVQCGKLPVVHAFCKNMAAKDEPVYAGFSYDRVYSHREKNPVSPFSIVNGPEKPVIVSHAGVFIVGIGNAEFVQCVDICVDHASLNSVTLLKQLFSDCDPAYIPAAIHHVVTSASIELQESALVTPYADDVLHVDQRYSRHTDYYLDGSNIQEIDNPRFACSVVFRDCGEATLSASYAHFDLLRVQHNKNAIMKRYSIDIDDDFVDFYLKKYFKEKNWEVVNFLLEFCPRYLILKFAADLFEYSAYLNDHSNKLFNLNDYSDRELNCIITTALKKGYFNAVEILVVRSTQLSQASINHLALQENLSKPVINALLLKCNILCDEAFRVVSAQLLLPYSSRQIPLLLQNFHRLSDAVLNQIAIQIKDFSEFDIAYFIRKAIDRLHDTALNSLVHNVSKVDLPLLELLVKNSNRLDYDSFAVIENNMMMLPDPLKEIVKRHPFYVECPILTKALAVKIIAEFDQKSPHEHSLFSVQKEETLRAFIRFSRDENLESFYENVKGKTPSPLMAEILSQYHLLDRFGKIKQQNNTPVLTPSLGDFVSAV